LLDRQTLRDRSEFFSKALYLHYRLCNQYPQGKCNDPYTCAEIEQLQLIINVKKCNQNIKKLNYYYNFTDISYSPSYQNPKHHKDFLKFCGVI
uniref:hypothetical protein n=1 Tax=uncultured Thermosynechococcus sp. TaxID=436945 RepID=UPI002639F76B